jgi:hypothetical protein
MEARNYLKPSCCHRSPHLWAPLLSILVINHDKITKEAITLKRKSFILNMIPYLMRVWWKKLHFISLSQVQMCPKVKATYAVHRFWLIHFLCVFFAFGSFGKIFAKEWLSSVPNSKHVWRLFGLKWGYSASGWNLLENPYFGITRWPIGPHMVVMQWVEGEVF